MDGFEFLGKLLAIFAIGLSLAFGGYLIISSIPIITGKSTTVDGKAMSTTTAYTRIAIGIVIAPLVFFVSREALTNSAIARKEGTREVMYGIFDFIFKR